MLNFQYSLIEILIIIILIVFCLYLFRPHLKKKNRTNLLIVLGSGGHTTQMLYMLKQLDFQKCDEIRFVLAQTDKTSEGKVKDFLQRENIKFKKIKWIRIFRSRQVKQSYFSAVFTTIKSFYLTFLTFLQNYNDSDILIMNGPGTCVPLAYTYFILNYVRISSTKIVFIQSWCRVNDLSLSGKLIRLIANKVIVHWEELSCVGEYYGQIL